MTKWLTVSVIQVVLHPYSSILKDQFAILVHVCVARCNFNEERVEAASIKATHVSSKPVGARRSRINAIPTVHDEAQPQRQISSPHSESGNKRSPHAFERNVVFGQSIPKRPRKPSKRHMIWGLITCCVQARSVFWSRICVVCPKATLIPVAKDFMSRTHFDGRNQGQV